MERLNTWRRQGEEANIEAWREYYVGGKNAKNQSTKGRRMWGVLEGLDRPEVYVG